MEHEIKKEENYPEIPFFRTEIDNRILKNRLMMTPSLYRVFQKKIDITRDVDIEFKYRMMGAIDNFATVFCTGEQGKKKSSTAQSIAERHDKTDFTAERIEFNYDEYKKDLEDSQPKQWFIIDEQAFEHGAGSIRIRHDIQNIIEQIRARGNSLILCSPELKYFDEKLFTFILEMLDDRLVVTCPFNKKPHEARRCECYYEKNFEVLLFETRSLVRREGDYIGFYVAPIKWNSQLWKDYSVKKAIHVENVKSGKAKDSPYQKIAEDLLNMEGSHRYLKNKKAMKLLLHQEYPNLTTEETQMTLEAILIEIEKRNEELDKRPEKEEGQEEDGQTPEEVEKEEGEETT